METSFIWIELEAKPTLTRRVIQTNTDIRMRIVSSSGNESLPLSADQFVPLFQILRRSSIEVSEQQIWITAVRPKTVEEHYQRIDPARIRVHVINFNAVVTCCLPTLELLW